MKTRSGTVVACTLLAIPFTAIGLVILWLILAAFYESFAANEWVKVPAEVLTADVVATGRRGSMRAIGSYRYEYKGNTYEGRQLGVTGGGGDNLGDWHQTMGAQLKAALAEKRPITVYVNPEDPSQAVVDRDVRWGMIMFLSIFGAAFGLIGAGSAFSAYKAATVKVWVPPKRKRFVRDD